MSSASSEPEVEIVPPPVREGEEEGKDVSCDGEGEGGQTEESEAKSSADSVVYSIHLALPGVTQPVDIVVSIL